MLVRLAEARSTSALASSNAAHPLVHQFQFCNGNPDPKLVSVQSNHKSSSRATFFSGDVKLPQRRELKRREANDCREQTERPRSELTETDAIIM